ncbi:Ubiquitin carboxyl-terminal hydrolase 16 [Bagarius yarrelli]|uniref:Ubiquitin carboxyl-terminal hydrolase n=1 Tax=Bagarius yarrelli TaxID=175774 RepID=A0A556TTY0_BAGYA|nr:Ubiquitin carboxyl-terminal hydrolase 16 [Bagarius yarrelli]
MGKKRAKDRGTSPKIDNSSDLTGQGDPKCYICDDIIYYSSTGQLAQLISNIKKQILRDSRHTPVTRKTNEEKNALSETAAEKEREKKEEQKDEEKLLKEINQESHSCTVPVRGFVNLGNTCFFNAVLQNLSQTFLLRELLSDFRDEEKSVLITPSSSLELEPLRVQLPRPGALTLAMCQLLNEVQVTKKDRVTPEELFKQVATRFKGFQQQDSQELLRYLLDGMRSEENIRVTAGIQNALKISGRPSEQKTLVKEYESNGVTKNFVERVFGGELTSTVMCTECKTVSEVVEVFLDLSLPVADEAYRKTAGGFANSRLKKSESAESGRSVETPQTSGNEDLLTGSGSKYQQKKAKKQARKQAKNQRRQQKLDAKSTPDLLTNQSEDASPEAPPPSADADDNASDLISQTEPTKQNQDEDDGEEENSTFNGFSSLSEEGIEKQEGKEDAGHEETALTTSVRALTLSEDQQKEVESGAESEIDLGAESGFVVVNADPKAAFSSLSSRVALNTSECSVEASLYQFTQVEQLTHTNSLLCGRKKVYTEAMKQMLISYPPPVLTLHLKRFQQGVQEGQTQLLYSLYGIVEHSGTMRTGHYTAFVKARPRTHTSSASLNGATDVEVPPKGSWFHISDTSVHSVTEARVQASQAYLLFYERIS